MNLFTRTKTISSLAPVHKPLTNHLLHTTYQINADNEERREKFKTNKNKKEESECEKGRKEKTENKKEEFEKEKVNNYEREGA